MECRQLSSKLIFDKIVVAAIILCLVFVFFKYKAVNLDILLPAIPIVIGMGYLIFYLPDHIEYDSENIYISRHRRKFSIRLNDIDTVKLTMLSIGHRNMWKIKFTQNGIESNARFYTRIFSSTFKDFISKLKAENPSVDINKITWSFDFDV